MKIVKILILSLFILATSLGVGLAATQEEWPTRPIELYVGWPPGGAADIAARILCVLHEQRPGCTRGCRKQTRGLWGVMLRIRS